MRLLLRYWLLCTCNPIPRAASGRNFQIREMFGGLEEEGKSRIRAIAADRLYGLKGGDQR